MNALRCTHSIFPVGGEVVNDVHSRLNSTLVKQRLAPGTVGELQQLLRHAHVTRQSISVAGRRHAMGGQQFLTDGLLLDTTALNEVVDFDYEQGLIEVQAGMVWTDLVAYLRREQSGRAHQWAIAQKQTGCDQLTLGGALSANVHGRGLNLPPIASNVESFSIVKADGQLVHCSRTENAELFSLAIGGYGLFGVISSVKLRLVPRTMLRRTVQLVRAESVMERFGERIADGAAFGDFQFAINDKSPDFLDLGILSTYTPVDTPNAADAHHEFVGNKLLTTANWQELIQLAHTNKQEAFDKYCKHYLATDGQMYSSDVFQLATYVEGYHDKLTARQESASDGSEVITELYVPRTRLAEFLSEAADLLRAHKSSVIYGTVRLIEQDTDSFLPWARQPWACTVLNLHVDHTPADIGRHQLVFRSLIELAIRHGGSYYLTYHRFATGAQLLGCYPEFEDFLELKANYDPRSIFQSDWLKYTQAIISDH